MIRRLGRRKRAGSLCGVLSLKNPHGIIREVLRSVLVQFVHEAPVLCVHPCCEPVGVLGLCQLGRSRNIFLVGGTGTSERQWLNLMWQGAAVGTLFLDGVNSWCFYHGYIVL